MTLRSKTIRLAHSNPELREHLLPLLREEKTAAGFPRSAYLPKDNPTLKRVETPPGLEIWTWEDWSERKQTMQFVGIAFRGKAEKPAWYHTFLNVNTMERAIEKTVSDFKAVMQRKLEVLNERKNFRHELQVGDVLYASWGYDQTNVNWYEVIATPTPKTILVREVASRVVSEKANITNVVPVPGKYIGPALKRIPGKYGVKIDDSVTAYKWDGKPKYQTSSGWGH